MLTLTNNDAQVEIVLELLADHTPATVDLYNWSQNFTGYTTPFTKFLDLIEFLDDAGEPTPLADWSEPAQALGFKELYLLGLALVEYANSPTEVVGTIQGLIDAETDGTTWCPGCQENHAGRPHSRD